MSIVSESKPMKCLYKYEVVTGTYENKRMKGNREAEQVGAVLPQCAGRAQD